MTAGLPVKEFCISRDPQAVLLGGLLLVFTGKNINLIVFWDVGGSG